MNVRLQSESGRPVVVYVHRYAPETEARQYAATSRLLHLLQRDYDVVYLSMRGPLPPDSRLRRGLRVVELPWHVNQASGLDKWLKTALYVLRFSRVLRELSALNPAFVICKETLPGIPGRIARRLRCPVLIAVSDWWWSILLGDCALGRALARRLEQGEVRQWEKAGAYVAANSEAEAKLVRAYGFFPQRIRVINAPHASEVFRPIDPGDERGRWGLTAEHWVAAIHGIIRPGKGYGQLLDWWARLVPTHPTWRLLVVGGAGGEQWCRRAVRRRRLESSVILTGWLPTQDDVNRVLNMADCLLVMRRNTPENMGIIPSTLFHSLATGRPTVAVGLPGIAEIVRTGVDGFLFEPDRYDSFLQTLENVASDPARAAAVGRAGLERGRVCFDPDRAAQRHVEWIDEILGRRA